MATLIKPSKNNKYYINPSTISFVENSGYGVQLIQASASSSCYISVYDPENGIGYNNDSGYKKWEITAYNNKFPDIDPYNIYVRLERNGISGLVVYDKKERSVKGGVVEIVTDESGGEKIIEGEEDLNFYYIKIGYVDKTDGETIVRKITYDTGYLSTEENRNAPGEIFASMFVPHYDDPEDPNKLTWIEAKTHMGIAGGLTMYIDNKSFDLPNIYDGLPIDGQTIYWEDIKDDNGVVAGKTLKAKIGGGTLGSLTNVGEWADSVADIDRIMVQKKGSDTWEAMDASEIGSASSVNISESGEGNAFTSFELSEDKKFLTLIKGETFALVSELEDKWTTDEELINNWNTAFSWGNHAEVGYALQTSLDLVSEKLNNFLEGTDTDSIINKWKELEAFLGGLAESDSLAAILSSKANQSALDETNRIVATKWTKDDAKIDNWDAAFSWGDHSKAGYAAKSYVDSTFVTITGNEDVTGIHNFTNGLKIGGNLIKNLKEDVIFIDANLVVRGGVTMYGDSESYDIPSIYDALPIDNDTIYWDGKVLKAKVGGGIAESVDWSDISGKPTWLLDDKINYSEIEGSPNLSVYQLKITSDNKLDYSLIGNTPDLSLYQSKITSSNKLAYSLISGTPDLSVYALKTDIPSLSEYATEQWVKDRGYATTDDLDSRINSLINGAPAAYDTLKEIADVLSGNVNSIGDIIATLGTKWTQDDTKISNWDTAFGWGNHADAGYAKKSDIEGKYVTIAGDEDITGLHNFTNGFKVGGNRIYESKDGIIYIDANVVLKGGLTMYGLDSSDVPSIIESLPIAGTTANSKGIAYFDDTQFTVSNGKVTIKDGAVGTDISEVENLLAQKGYATQDWVTGQNYLPKSSYTASDVLTKLKTVDGIGSGLDSDMLDGYNESSFLIAESKETSDINSTFGYTTNRPFIARLSDISQANYPNPAGDGGYGNIIHFGVPNKDTAFQLYSAYNTYRLLYRMGTWHSDGSGSIHNKAWKEVAFTDSNVASATKLNDDSVFTIWGQTFFVNGKPKSVDGAMTVNGNATFNGNLSATEVSVNGITLKKSKDGILYLDGNLVVKGGVTMYGTDSSSAPSILDSLPVASTSAKGIAQFNSTYFSVSNGIVSIKDGSVGLNETELNEILNGKGYLVSSDLGALAFKSNLLAADIPNLDWSKITSGKPTTISGYGITDAITTSNIGSQSVDFATRAGDADTLGGNSASSFVVKDLNISANSDVNVVGYAYAENGFPVAGGALIAGNPNIQYKMILHGRNGVFRFNTMENGSLTGWKTVAFTDSNITGNAASATYAETAGSSTKAYQDGNGDNIANTYLSKSGGTINSISKNTLTLNSTESSGISSYLTFSCKSVNKAYVGWSNAVGTYLEDASGNYISVKANGAYFNNQYKLWHEGNDGVSSGLDADLLDGQHGSYYASVASLDNYFPKSGGKINGSVEISGNLLVGGGITMYSQRSLKNVLDERGLSLEELSSIKPTRYTWKDNRDSNIHFGGIADDIQQVLPEVVYKTKEGILTMDYGNAGFAIASSLIKPVVDHEERIKALEKENELLKQELNRLRA